MRLILLAFVLLVLPTLALADACASGTVAALLAQGTCTIGDMTFDFTEYSPYEPSGTSGLGEDSVTFTPLANGFELSGDFLASVTGSSTYGSGELYYTVTSGAGGVNGVSDSIDGSDFVTNPTSCCVDDVAGTYNFVENALDLGYYSYSEPFQTQYYGGAPTSGDYESGPVSFAAIPSASGVAFIEPAANSEYYDSSAGYYVVGGTGSASASFTSADFLFSEAPAVAPEPKSVLLFATVAVALLGAVRRRVRGNNR
jgi:hypothetical protein